jgi:Tfp pilus assembly protein FimT
MTAKLKFDRRKKTKTQAGFSLMQLLITLAVIGIVSGLAFMGITSARQRIRLTNSSRLLASYIERARVDSVRRHPLNAADMAGVQMLNSNSYRVKMDFDGDGDVDTRDVTLDDGVVFATDALTIVFDWRGRLVDLPLTEIKVTIAMQWGDDANDQRVVDVTRSGDVTIDSDVYLDDVPNVNVNVNGMTGLDSGSTINGNNNPNPSPTASPQASPGASPSASPSPEATPSESPSPGASPTPTASPGASPSPTPSGSPSPSPSVSPTPCNIAVTTSPSPLSFPKKGSGTISFTGVPSNTVTFTSGPNNLKITKGVGNAFAVNSLNNTRGNFTLVFSTPCGSRNVSVTITN